MFLNHAADTLSAHLTGAEIVRATVPHAIDYGVEVPHPKYPFMAPNKRTALSENLQPFTERQRYRILKDLLEHPSVAGSHADNISTLRLHLLTRYGHLGDEAMGEEVNEELVQQTRHWLATFPDALRLFNQSLLKYEARTLERNLLDDLRLSFEKLLHIVLKNERSLENQLPALGGFVKERGGSPEFSNMFSKLVEYYTKYQNTYVKHDDAVIEEEIEFVLEITSAFMKHMVRLTAKSSREGG